MMDILKGFIVSQIGNVWVWGLILALVLTVALDGDCDE